MGNRQREGLARKRRKRLTQLTCPPPTLLDIQTDQAEINLFISLSRFRRIIREIKRSIYRRPQHVWEQPNFDNRVVR